MAVWQEGSGLGSRWPGASQKAGRETVERTVPARVQRGGRGSGRKKERTVKGGGGRTEHCRTGLREGGEEKGGEKRK
jgi:hypothetical protein